MVVRSGLAPKRGASRLVRLLRGVDLVAPLAELVTVAGRVDLVPDVGHLVAHPAHDFELLALLGDEVRLVTAPESGLLIGRYTGAGETRVSPAAMEALAIVAYRQPVTRGVIERIRGVDSDYVIRSLIARRLIVEQGRADTPGRPILYATSFEFLERFGLASLDELPPLDAEVGSPLSPLVEPVGAFVLLAGMAPVTKISTSNCSRSLPASSRGGNTTSKGNSNRSRIHRVQPEGIEPP